jgi:hypothetical protein
MIQKYLSRDTPADRFVDAGCASPERAHFPHIFSTARASAEGPPHDPVKTVEFGRILGTFAA